jgi:hypothetical protein
MNEKPKIFNREIRRIRGKRIHREDAEARKRSSQFYLKEHLSISAVEFFCGFRVFRGQSFAQQEHPEHLYRVLVPLLRHVSALFPLVFTCFPEKPGLSGINRDKNLNLFCRMKSPLSKSLPLSFHRANLAARSKV